MLRRSAHLAAVLGSIFALSCVGDCPVASSSTDWEGTDSSGNYLECQCVESTDSGSDDSSAVAEPASCFGGMTPRPGCGAFDLGTVDLSADPITLSFDDGEEHYSYSLTSGQRIELRQACGIE